MKRLIKSLMITTAVSLAITGCATTKNVTPQYVSPSTYASYDCTALAQEYQRITNYLEQTSKQQFSLASTGVNIGMHGNRHGVYPTVSFGLGQTRDTQARDGKLSRLYGERDAVVQSARLKSCHFANGLKIFGEE